MRPTASPRAAVLGRPIGHSMSPLLHRAAYAHLGLDIEYSRREVDVENLTDFLSGEGSEPGWLGWSVTMPLKAAMVEHMHSVTDRVRALGALNTVVHRPGGLTGANTDVDGIVAALREVGTSPELGLGTGTVAIIGAGSTAVAALAALADLGFDDVRVYARAPERVAALGPVSEAWGVRCEASNMDEFAGDAVSGALDAVVCTLPPRAADGLSVGLRDLRTGVALLDVSYAPWPSALADAWEHAGGRVVSGLTMLLHQAVAQVELFTAEQPRPRRDAPEDDHAAMVRRMGAAVGL